MEKPDIPTQSDKVIEKIEEIEEIGIKSITHEHIRILIEEESGKLGISGESDAPDGWGDVFEQKTEDEELKRIYVHGQIDDILIRYGELAIVKEKLLEFITKLKDEKEQRYAEEHIKHKLQETMRKLQELLEENDFVLLENGYFTFLGYLRQGIVMRLPLTANLRKTLAHECFLLYQTLKAKKKIPPEQLRAVNTFLTMFVSGIKLQYELSENLREALGSLTDNKVPDNVDAKLPEQSGRNSIANFSIIPPLNEFPNIEPYKREAEKLLSDIRGGLLDILLPVTSFKLFIEFEAELSGKKISDFPEADFFALCRKQKQKIDRLYEKTDLLEQKLQEIADPKTVRKYGARVKKHIKSVWENGIFPALAFFAHISLGVSNGENSQWT